jgi:hypothetical protein
MGAQAMEKICAMRKMSALALLVSMQTCNGGVSSGRELDVDAVSQLRAAALSGDDKAAYELAHWHIRTGDSGGYRFYLRLAAEQGSCEAVVEYRRLHDSDLLTAPDTINKFIDENDRACRTTQ